MCLFSILCSAKPQTARTTTNSCHHAFQASRYWKVPCFKATVSCVGCRGFLRMQLCVVCVRGGLAETPLSSKLILCIPAIQGG